ncbi:unnamed protein product [Meganyctiphanes norvegica]|uniref:Gamma-glutamyltranspeptidase 1 n=1 Tax=Meganyctiphanes norvegica TaxID=48144 RepID=A0AAV2SRW2_MEGNR
MARFVKKCLILGAVVGNVCLTDLVTGVSVHMKKDLIPPIYENGNFSHIYVNSTLGEYNSAAVSADGIPCAQISRDILQQNGSAIDATIAGLFCVGVINAQSMGLGGGFFATYYERSTGKAYSLNAREKAPGSASKDMYHGNSTLSKKGGLAVGVPGEVRGYYKMYQNWGGSLPWADLIEPTIKLCEEGHEVNWAMAKILHWKRKDILAEPSMSVFVNEVTGDVWQKGDIIRRPQLAKTLRILQQEPDALYTGALANQLIDDLNSFGSIITHNDLRSYVPVVKDAINVSLSHGNMTLFSVPPPGSGLILGFILNILDEYGLTMDSINDENTVHTHHRITEAFKWAYAKRTQLGDADFVDLEELSHNLVSDAYAASIKSQITDDRTFQDPQHYGAVTANVEDSGTAQFSLLGPNGDAVSVTSTINLGFGAGIRSVKTGIILNNEMDDFSAPGFKNSFGIPPSPANFISPRKRPMSSMCPAVVVDSAGDVRLVLGGAGGTKISTSVAWVALRNLWLGDNIKEAIDARRIHHQLLPMELAYEDGIAKNLVAGMEAIGHKSKKLRFGGSVVCGVARDKIGKIYANSDMRKAGEVTGF